MELKHIHLEISILETSKRVGRLPALPGAYLCSVFLQSTPGWVVPKIWVVRKKGGISGKLAEIDLAGG